MHKQKTLDLLQLNGIEEVVFYQKLHRTLLLGVFEVVCKEIKKHNTKATEKNRFRTFQDKVIPTKKIIKQYAGCELSNEDYEEMALLLAAFFSTGDPRKKFDTFYREQLTQKQGGQCAICKRNITAKCAHLDHIIPWDYVGDQLDNNYQMLCETCNERKGTATYFEFSMLLLNKSATFASSK